MLTHVLRFKEKQVSVSSVSRRVLKFKQFQAVCAGVGDWPAQRSRIKARGCVCHVYGPELHNSIEMIVFLIGMIHRQSFLELYNVCSG